MDTTRLAWMERMEKKLERQEESLQAIRTYWLPAILCASAGQPGQHQAGPANQMPPQQISANRPSTHRPSACGQGGSIAAGYSDPVGLLHLRPSPEQSMARASAKQPSQTQSDQLGQTPAKDPEAEDSPDPATGGTEAATKSLDLTAADAGLHDHNSHPPGQDLSCCNVICMPSRRDVECCHHAHAKRCWCIYSFSIPVKHAQSRKISVTSDMGCQIVLSIMEVQCLLHLSICMRTCYMANSVQPNCLHNRQPIVYFYDQLCRSIP